MTDTLTVEQEDGHDITIRVGDTLEEGGGDVLSPVGDTFQVMDIGEEAVAIDRHDGRGREAVDREAFEELLVDGDLVKVSQ